MKYELKSREDYQIQADYIRKHTENGGTAVIDNDGNLIRFEYDNPVFQFYKHQYEEKLIALAGLSFATTELELSAEGKTPEYPPEIIELKARIYKHLNL